MNVYFFFFVKLVEEEEMGQEGIIINQVQCGDVLYPYA